MKKNKKVVVIYTEDDWNVKVPLQKSPDTRRSFEDWHIRGLKNGIELFRASINWYDPTKNEFNRAWAFRNDNWVKIDDPISPDLIFDKTPGSDDYELYKYKMDIYQNVKIFNHPLFRLLFDNKVSQYLCFKKWMPLSLLVTSKNEFVNAIKDIPSDKVVIKPLYGSGGKGIRIEKKNSIDSDDLHFPLIIQECIKSTKGVPGFNVKNEHIVADLRIIFINHTMIYSLSRIAKNNSLFTNFHQGAHAMLVPLSKIPKKVIPIVSDIQKTLKMFTYTNYSLDFMFTNDGEIKLIEMNTTPGFDLLHIVGDEAIKNKHFNAFFKILHDTN